MQEPTPKTRKRHAFLLGSLLVLLCLWVFARSLGHGFVVFDDHSKVIENPTVTAYARASLEERLLTPRQGYVIPVTVATWALLYDLGDGNAWAFHGASLAVHGFVVLLLFGILMRWSLPWAAFGAAVLAAHPVVVEPVAWVTGLKDLLAAGFALGATWLFVTGVERGDTGRPRVASAVLLFLLSALSKPTTVLLPGAWLFWLLVRRRQRALPRREETSRQGQDTAPRAWWMAGAALGLGLGLGLLGWTGHETLVSDASPPVTLGDGRALQTIGLQVSNLLWPVDLHPLYFVTPGPAWKAGATWLGLATLLLLGAAFWRARRHPMASLGLSLMVATYLPVSNLLATPRQIADSYLYLPLAGGLLALVAGLAAWPRQELARRPQNRWGLAVAGLLMVAGLAILSGQQVQRWVGGSALWQPLIERWPEWDKGYYGLATLRLRQSRDAEAASLYRQAYGRGYRTEHLADFGVALAASGQREEAECVLVEAIHHGDRPKEALRNYGRLLGGDLRRAPRYPRAAARLLPASMEALSETQHPGTGRLLERLEALRRQAGPSDGPLRWPRGSCASLSTFRP